MRIWWVSIRIYICDIKFFGCAVCFNSAYHLQISVIALVFMFLIKMIVDNFAACCCFPYLVASIVMSLKIMT